MCFGLRAFVGLRYVTLKGNKEVLQTQVLRMMGIFKNPFLSTMMLLSLTLGTPSYTCVAMVVLSADHTGHQAVTTQFTNAVRDSKNSSSIQSLLRNTLGGHTLPIFPALMS